MKTLGPTILEVLNEPQKMVGSKKKSIRAVPSFIINSLNKSEAKAEERANSSQSRIAAHNVIQKYKSIRE
jgi:hypothetical protein